MENPFDQFDTAESNPFDQFDQNIQQTEPSMPEQQSMLSDINQKGGEIIDAIPGSRLVAELASAINRGVINTADFFTTKPVNGLLATAGIDANIPAIADVPGIKQATQGNIMDEGFARDVVQKSGETVGPGVATAQAFRTAASLAPTVASGAQTVGQNVLKQMGSGTAGLDAKLSALSGVGAEIGKEYGGDTGELVGAFLAPTAGVGMKALTNQVLKAGKMIPEQVPEKLLESAMKFRPSIKPAQRANMTKTALREGIAPTVKGLEKIVTRLDSLDSGLNKIIDDATAKGTLIPKGQVYQKLGALRKNVGGAKVNATSDLKAIDKVARELDLGLKRINKTKLTPRELQDLKTDAYKRINFDLTQGKASFAKNEATKAIAKQAKESLENIDPDVKTINKSMGDLLELNKELERVVSRLDNRNLISLDTAVKIGAGASTNTEVGTAAGTISSILGAPRVKAKTALALYNLRKNADIRKQIENLDPILAESFLLQSLAIEDQLTQDLPE